MDRSARVGAGSRFDGATPFWAGDTVTTGPVMVVRAIFCGTWGPSSQHRRSWRRERPGTALAPRKRLPRTGACSIADPSVARGKALALTGAVVDPGGT